jgi:hypothetical protein
MVRTSIGFGKSYLQQGDHLWLSPISRWVTFRLSLWDGAWTRLTDTEIGRKGCSQGRTGQGIKEQVDHERRSWLHQGRKSCLLLMLGV